MKNLWDKSEGLKYIKHYKKYNVSNDLALRIYTTHSLGGEKKLVLHGGGNTSVKTNYKNIFGEINKVIYVKVGQSEEIDIEIVKQTREAIGASKRLRLDPNEKYDPDTFFKIVPKLIPLKRSRFSR